MVGFELGEDRAPERRAARPHQAPPGARNGTKRSYGVSQGSQTKPKTQKTAGNIDYLERITREAKDFDDRRDANIDEYLIQFAEAAQHTVTINKSHAEDHQSRVEQAFENACRDHPCCLLTNCGEGENCLLSGGHNIVIVVDFDHHCALKIPVSQCRQCKMRVTVHPYAVDCVPTTATEHCQTWIRRSVVHFFRDLHKNNGLSANAFVHALSNSDRRFDPQGSTFTADDGSLISCTLKPAQLITADLEAWKVEHKAHEMKLVGQDPFAYCPTCSKSNREALTDGTPVPPVRLSVMTDAMNAADRFAAAGRRQNGIKPTTSLFLGEAAQQIMDETESGALAKNAERGAKAAADAAAGEEGPCTTALHCNRESIKQKRGEMDIVGTVAIVCPHIFPGLGCCIPMTTPENHHYYDVLLEYLLRTRPDTKDVYLDLMCRYRGRFKALIDKLSKEDIFPISADDINMLLPMMHAFDHNHACQLVYSALYAEGVGRRVGEQTEVLWSEIKPFFKIARYMTRAHWWDNYNCLLWLLSLRKQERFPAMLADRIARIDTKVDEFKNDIFNLKAEAATHGVKDLEAALPFLDSSTTAPAAALSVGAKYVEVLLKLRSLDNMDEDKGMYPLLMPRSTGIHAHGAVTDDTKKQRLKRLKATYQAQLGLPLGTDWAVDSQEYRVALQELSKHFMQEYALLVENQVFKRAVLIKNMPRVESGHNAKKANVRLTSMGKNIGELLKFYFTWEAYGTDTPRTTLTAQRLEDAFNRNFPWNRPEGDGGTLPAGANGSESAQRHFALRYHAAKNQLQRTVEEVEMLKKEVVRLFNWCEERRELVASKLEWFTSKIDAKNEANRSDTVSVKDKYENNRMIRIMKGKLAVHSIEQSRLMCIHNETTERLKCKLSPV